MERRQRKVFSISTELFKQLFIDDVEHHYKVANGIPKDAKIVQAGYLDETAWVPQHPQFYITLEHESFPMVEEGTVMSPEQINICPTVTTL